MAQCRARHYFETDAREVEDQYDSTGVDGLPDRPTSSIVDLNLFSSEDEETGLTIPADKDANISPQNERPKLPEQMSANGRALLRKHFSSSSPIELPRLHTTVAFSEPQIHAVLKTISDETVRSSLNSMRALVLQAVYRGRRQTPARFRKALIRGESPSESTTVASDIDTDIEGNTSDGYTSGAIASDEQIGLASFGMGTTSYSGHLPQSSRQGPEKNRPCPAANMLLYPVRGIVKEFMSP